MTTAEVSDMEYTETMTALHSALVGDGRVSDAANIIADQSRLFLKQAIKFTPPKTKAQGENAIKGDLAKLFTPVEDDFAQYIASHFGVTNVNHWLHNDISNENYEVRWEKLDMQGYGMDELHDRKRDSRGRVRGKNRTRKENGIWVAPYVVSRSAWNAFFKKLKLRVGNMKGGWIKAYNEVGGKATAWIQRHADKNLGGYVNHLEVQNNPSFTMTNHAKGIGMFEHVARETFRARGEAMKKNLKLILNKYSRSIARGIRPTKQSQATAESFFSE